MRQIRSDSCLTQHHISAGIAVMICLHKQLISQVLMDTMIRDGSLAIGDLITHLKQRMVDSIMNNFLLFESQIKKLTGKRFQQFLFISRRLLYHLDSAKHHLNIDWQFKSFQQNHMYRNSMILCEIQFILNILRCGSFL